MAAARTRGHRGQQMRGDHRPVLIRYGPMSANDSTLWADANHHRLKGEVMMRFGWLMAALAALWMRPAQAVTISLTAPDPTQGVHQKITVTGLGADNVLKASAGGDPTGYWTDLYPGGILNGNSNSIGSFGCETIGTACQDYFAFEAADFPAKIVGYLGIIIHHDVIFVDWAKAANNVCKSQPPYNHPNFCGFAWEYGSGTGKLQLNIDVLGPSTNWGYSVQTLGTFAVPEPATWALIIIGMGIAGAAMRRRHRQAIKFSFT